LMTKSSHISGDFVYYGGVEVTGSRRYRDAETDGR
jgi:hypothetical protein